MLPGIEINCPLYDFVPLLAVRLSEVFAQFNYVLVQLLNTTVYIRLFRVGNRPELVRVLNDLREVPQLRRSLHVLHLLSIIGSFHVLELLGSLL